MQSLSLSNEGKRLKFFDFGIKNEENLDNFLNGLFTDECNF